MKFDLQISCDNAAFQPARDDADEAERYAATSAEVARILLLLAGSVEDLTSGRERSGFLRDHNGNRCGQWSLGEGEESETEAPDTLRPTLSFDGWGINGPDEHRTRLATFTSPERAAEWGPLFAGALEMRVTLAKTAESLEWATNSRNPANEKQACRDCAEMIRAALSGAPALGEGEDQDEPAGIETHARNAVAAIDQGKTEGWTSGQLLDALIGHVEHMRGADRLAYRALLLAEEALEPTNTENREAIDAIRAALGRPRRR